MGKALIDFGLQTAQGVIGAGMGLALEGHNDRRQLKQQRKLQELEMSGQRSMTDYNMMKQLQMWKDTNYGAQMEQLTKAGLNPGLIYGMGGAGGATTGQSSGNVTGGHAPTGGGEAIALGTTAAQMGLLKAQKENIEADTANKKADIPLKGAQVTKTAAETASLTQGIENQKAQQELTEIEGRIAYVKEHIATTTQNAAVSMIMTEIRKSIAQMQILENDAMISGETKDEKIKIVSAELAGIYAENELKKTMKGKSEAEITKMTNDIKLAWDQLSNAQTQTAIDQQIADFQTSFGGQAAAILQSLIGIIPAIKGKKTATTVTHKGGAKNETIHKRQ